VQQSVSTSLGVQRTRWSYLTGFSSGTDQMVTMVGETIVPSEYGCCPFHPLQQQTEVGQDIAYVDTGTPSMKCTSLTKSNRGSTGKAVQVTQGQGSTPSVLEYGTVPGTKRFNECASYSSSDDSTIATHDKYKVTSTNGSTKSSAGTNNTGRTSQKNEKENVEKL
jgi:hypothetical protein